MSVSNKIPLYQNPQLEYFEHLKKCLKWCTFVCLPLALILSIYYPEFNITRTLLPILIAYPIPTYFVFKNKEHFFIQIGDSYISFKNSFWIEKQTIRASEIRFIEINLDHIHISTKDMRSINIWLNHTKYENMVRIKDEIRIFRLTALA